MDRDNYARDRIRFLERLLFDLMEILAEDYEDIEALVERLCAERGGV